MHMVVRIIATAFGIGYLPLFPGTWASAAAVGLAWILPNSAILVLGVFSAVAGLSVCRTSQVVLGSADPKSFVMDEVCGMALSVLWLPKSMILYLSAFILFRILDVSKPWPISKVQRSRHATSIMWDDILAGLFANLLMQAFLVARPYFGP